MTSTVILAKSNLRFSNFRKSPISLLLKSLTPGDKTKYPIPTTTPACVRGTMLVSADTAVVDAAADEDGMGWDLWGHRKGRARGAWREIESRTLRMERAEPRDVAIAFRAATPRIDRTTSAVRCGSVYTSGRLPVWLPLPTTTARCSLFFFPATTMSMCHCYNASQIGAAHRNLLDIEEWKRVLSALAHGNFAFAFRLRSYKYVAQSEMQIWRSDGQKVYACTGLQ